MKSRETSNCSEKVVVDVIFRFWETGNDVFWKNFHCSWTWEIHQLGDSTTHQVGSGAKMFIKLLDWVAKGIRYWALNLAQPVHRSSRLWGSDGIPEIPLSFRPSGMGTYILYIEECTCLCGGYICGRYPSLDLGEFNQAVNRAEIQPIELIGSRVSSFPGSYICSYVCVCKYIFVLVYLFANVCESIFCSSSTSGGVL